MWVSLLKYLIFINNALFLILLSVCSCKESRFCNTIMVMFLLDIHSCFDRYLPTPTFVALTKINAS